MPIKKKREKNKEKKQKLKESQSPKESQIIQIGQTKQQNKILKIFLISMILILFATFLIAFISNKEVSFEYRGVKFKVVKFCDQGPCLITYNTKLPVTYQEKKMNYNFYLRKDPRKLESKVPFNGTLNIKKNLVMNITFDKYCKGYESIAVSNFATLYGIIGVKINPNSTLSCGLFDEYMYIALQESNKTSIEQIGPSCYNINIKDCEILEGMERFMVETFVKINEEL